MLFCIGCQKEDPEQTPQLNKGTFYTSAGKTYNTDIRLILTTQDLTAPHSSELAFELQNDTDYFLRFWCEEEKLTLSKWVEEEWKIVERPPTKDEELNIDLDVQYLGTSLQPHGTYPIAKKFGKLPLDAGVYRLDLPITVTDMTVYNYPVDPVERDWKGTNCVAEIYFTILPAPTE
jgi:hypothetical protein